MASGASKGAKKIAPTGSLKVASANFFGVPKNVREAAKRQYKAGTPRENPNDPYTDADAKLIRNFKPKKGKA